MVAIRQILSFHTIESTIWKSPFFFSPTLLLLYIAIICLYSSYKAPYQTDTSPNIHTQKSKLLFKLVFFFSCLISLTLLTDIMVIITHVMKERIFVPVLGYYFFTSFVIWISNTYYLMKKANKFSIWHSFQSSFYGLSIVGETMVGWLWLITMLQAGQSSAISIYDKWLLSSFVIRYTLEVTITLFSFIRKFTDRRRANEGQSETSHLISSSTRTENYGSTIITTTTVYSSNNSISTKLLKTLPFIWPDDNFELQARLIICIFLMLAGVAINVLTPIQVGYVVDHLEGGSGKFAWAAVLAYAGLRYFQGGSGVLKTIQNQTWQPVEEHLLTEISTELKEYLDGLSPEERAYMKVDEAQKAIFSGAKCIIQILEQVSFHIFPLLATMAVSITVLGAGYTFLGGLIVFFTMVLYTYLTIVITEKQNAKDGNKKSSVALSLTQNSIISTGVLVGSLWYAWQISKNKLTAGDFVVFNMYILQLGTPLRFLGNYYTMTQKSFSNLGKISMLFTNKETSTNIQEVNVPSATDGHIVFDRVQFGYDGERDIFKNLSFTIKRDAFVAVVGPSGCGKSTLMRLIFRFYDPLSGHIYVNGQDSKNIEHSILRQNIGFIPQNTILFNDTVLYNIRHGNIDASDEDVFYAAKVAQVHNQILKFPNGYATKLGERGYKISDSIKQRIAIARAVLKNPNLLLLDESTSALGAEREKSIQKALADFSDNCTVFFATRRLSSIVNADVILVMKDGQLVEFGTHKDLLERANRSNVSSLYSNMWQKQLENSNYMGHDSKSNSTLKVNRDDNSELEQPICNGTNNEESSTSNKKRSSFIETEVTTFTETTNSEIPKSCTTSFPTLTTPTLTTYTDFTVSKSSQLSMPIPNETYFSTEYTNHISNNNIVNTVEEAHNPIKPTRPTIVEPSYSLDSSNPAELITPKLLESDLNQFDKLIMLESGAHTSSNTTKCTPTGQTIHNNANADNSSYSSDTASNSSNVTNLYTSNTSKLILNEHYENATYDIYNHTQITIPTSLEPKSSLITSNTGEFILPIFSELDLRKFDRLSKNKARTVPDPEEITNSKGSSMQAPNLSITKNNQDLSTKTNNNGSCLQDISAHKSESNNTESEIILSKQSEIIDPEFLNSNFGRFDPSFANASAKPLLSETKDLATGKKKTIPIVQTCLQQKSNSEEQVSSNNHGAIYNPIQLVTLESKELTSNLISSYPAELTAPKFSDSKLKQSNKSIVNKPCVPSTSGTPEFSEVITRKDIPSVVTISNKSGPVKFDSNPTTSENFTVPSLVESKPSFISSNAAELIIFKNSDSKLKELSKSIKGDICTFSTSKSTDPSTESNPNKTRSVTPTSKLSEHRTSNPDSNTLQKSQDLIQITIPSIVESKSTLADSSAAELIIPEFSKIPLTTSNELTENEPCTSSSSEDIGSHTTNGYRKVYDVLPTFPNPQYDTPGIEQSILQHSWNNYMEVTIPLLAESKFSPINSKVAELIIPESSDLLLKRFSKPFMDTTPSIKITKASIANSRTKSSKIVYSTERSEYDSSELGSIITQKTNGIIQLTIPSPVQSKSSIISCNTAELITPQFSDSELKRFSNDCIKRSNAVSSSREITNTDTSTSNLLEYSTGEAEPKNQSIRSDKEYGAIKSDNPISITYTMLGPVQLSKKQFFTTKDNRASSKPADLNIPVFSKSNLKRFGGTTLSKSGESSPLKLPKMNAFNNSKDVTVNMDMHKKSNIVEPNVNNIVSPEHLTPFQLSIPEVIEPTTHFISSENANLIMPLFSRSSVTKIVNNKTTKRGVTSTPDASKPELYNPILSEDVDKTKEPTISNSKSKGKDAIRVSESSASSILRENSSKKNSSKMQDDETRDIQPNVFANSTKSSSNYIKIQDTKPEENSKAKTFITSDNVCSDISKSVIKLPEESTTLDNNKVILPTHPYPTISGDTVTSYSDIKTDKNVYTHQTASYSDKSKPEVENTLESMDKKDQTSTIAPNYISSPCDINNKSPHCSKIGKYLESSVPVPLGPAVFMPSPASAAEVENLNLNQVIKLHNTQDKKASYRNPEKSDKKNNMVAKPKPVSSVNVNQEKLSNILPNQYEKPKNVKTGSCDISAISDPRAQREDEISHNTLDSNIITPTDLKRQNSKEQNSGYSYESNISRSTSPSTTTIVQLEVSKSAELSTIGLHTTDIANYIKSEQIHSTDLYAPKESKLRRRHIVKSDNSKTPGINSPELNKKGNTQDYIIEITKQNELPETNNDKARDRLSKDQDNGDDSQLQASNRNWKKRLRHDSPTPVLTNESFVFANARLYIPRTTERGLLDSDLSICIYNILHLYENAPVNQTKRDPIPLDKTLERKEKIEITNDSNYNEQSTSKAVVINNPNVSVHTIKGSTDLTNSNNLYPKIHTNEIDKSRRESFSGPNETPRIREFNKPKYIQLYTPPVAKLVSFDIFRCLSYYIFEKLQTAIEPPIPSVPSVLHTNCDNSGNEDDTPISQISIEIPAKRSSNPLNHNTTIRKRCKCKKNCERKNNTLEVLMEREIIEVMMETETIEIIIESGDEMEAEIIQEN